MLRINRQTDYAIRVLLSLSKRQPGQLLSTSLIQNEMLIPPALAQRIVAELARGGFIRTYPGRDGGLALARRAQEINLRQVVEHFEGPLQISDCLTADFDCPFERKCPVRCHWTSVQAALAAELEKVTLAQLAREAAQVDPPSAALPKKKAARQDRERSVPPPIGNRARRKALIES